MSGKGEKILKGRTENTLPKLVKKVKTLKFINHKDLLPLNDLSQTIFQEWLKVRRKFRKKSRNQKTNDRLYAEFEAEEEIVVGLLVLLNEKIFNYIAHICFA